MFIGISGNICAGKSEVARFLRLQGFTQVYLSHPAAGTPTKPQPAHFPANKLTYSQDPTLSGTPITNIGKETSLDDDGNLDDHEDDDTSASVKNLIHELTDLSAERAQDLPEPYHYSHSNHASSAMLASERAHKEPMALWNGPYGERAIDSHGCAVSMTFQSVEEMRDHVTRNWQTNYVTTDIYDLHTLETLSQRPFFLHIAVDAPVTLRWARYTKRKALEALTTSPLAGPTLESFIVLCDDYMYSENDGMAAVLARARLTIVNQTQSPELLYLKLANLNLADPDRLRPSWDSYFMRLANLAALRSNCMKRQVGCVLVRDKRVIATGYNGTPRGLKNCNEGGCERCNDSANYSGASLGTCLCLHAEENALLESGRDRIGQGSTLYCNTCPCLTCSIKIVQSGITEVVYLQPYSMDKASEEVLKGGNTILRQFIPPSEGLVL